MKNITLKNIVGQAVVVLFLWTSFSNGLANKTISGKGIPVQIAANRGNVNPNLDHRSFAPFPEKTINAPSNNSKSNFRAAYNHAGRPRIMILFNEILEREYKDYKSGKRWVWQDIIKGKLASENANKTIGLKKSPESGKKASLKKTKSSFNREIDLNRRHIKFQENRIFRKTRSEPAEWDILRARQYFMEPFIKAGVQLIDPISAIRIFASQSNGNISGKSSRILEFSAWKHFTDIIVEFLFSWNSKKRKWEISTKSVEISTGRIISIATSHEIQNSVETIFPGQRVELPQSSYMSPLTFRDTNAIIGSRTIAKKMMNQMASAWANLPKSSAKNIQKEVKNVPQESSAFGKKGKK